MEEDLILKAYRNKKNPTTIDIDIKANVYGYELYRISLSLLDKVMKLDTNKPIEDEKDIEDFFESLKNNYVKYFKQRMEKK